MKVKVSHLWVPLCATPRTVAHQAPLSMGFSRQDYWSGLPFPSQGILLTQGCNLSRLHLRSEPPRKPGSMWELNSPTRGQNLSPVLWKHRVLTTGLPWESLTFSWFLNGHVGVPCCSAGKESACNAGNTGSDPGWGRCPGEENGHPLQYSCLESPTDGGAWRAPVHGVARVWHDSATKPAPKDRTFSPCSVSWTLTGSFFGDNYLLRSQEPWKMGFMKLASFSVYCVVGKEQISQDGGVRLPRPTASPSCRALCEQGVRSSRVRK